MCVICPNPKPSVNAEFLKCDEDSQLTIKPNKAQARQENATINKRVEKKNDYYICMK